MLQESLNEITTESCFSKSTIWTRQLHLSDVIALIDPAAHWTHLRFTFSLAAFMIWLTQVTSVGFTQTTLVGTVGATFASVLVIVVTFMGLDAPTELKMQTDKVTVRRINICIAATLS
jgi:hypothetical protein